MEIKAGMFQRLFVIALAVKWTLLSGCDVTAPEGRRWTATASGGSGGDHSFRWYKSLDHGMTRWPVRQATTSSNTDTYGETVSQSFMLIAEADRGTETATASLSVYVEPDDCDPQVEICIGDPGLVATEAAPDHFYLDANYPNPFNPATEVAFGLAEASLVRLVVVDVLGREIALPVDTRLDAGRHVAIIDAGSWASGVYIYRIEVVSDDGVHYTESRQMTLLK